MIYVNRDFQCPYDDNRIWLYPCRNENILCINVINIHTRFRSRNDDDDDADSTMGEAWIEIEYPKSMHMFEAMNAVLDQITRDFELDFGYHDSIYDTVSNSDIEFTRSNVTKCFINNDMICERDEPEEGLYVSKGRVNEDGSVVYEPLKTNGSLMRCYR